MKLFIGNDIVYIPGFKKSLNAAFIKKVFSNREIRQIEEYRANPIVRYATTWAAKEAVFKAMEQMYHKSLKLNWKEIEIVRANKIPKVIISKKYYKNLNFSLSLSYHKEYAFAVVIVY